MRRGAVVVKDASWSLEKKVNLPFLVAMVLQTLAMLTGAAWYAARQDARIAALETTDLRIITERDIRRKAVDDRFEFMAKDRDRLIRVETKTENIERLLGRIETKLDTIKSN